MQTAQFFFWCTNYNDHCLLGFTCWIISKLVKLKYLLIFPYLHLTLLTCRAYILRIWQIDITNLMWLWRVAQILWKVCCLWKSDAMTCNNMQCNYIQWHFIACHGIACHGIACPWHCMSWHCITCQCIACHCIAFNFIAWNCMSCLEFFYL